MSQTEVGKFNMLFEELLEKMISKFNNDKLKSYRRLFIMMKTATPKTPVNLFMSGCVGYKQQIKLRDDKFFMNSKEINEKSKYFGNFTEDCGISEYWTSLSPATQTAIWEYIQSLFVLGEIIINKNSELFEKYNKMYLKDFKDDLKNINNSKQLLEKINS